MELSLQLSLLQAEIAYHEYKKEYERSKFYDRVEELYDGWNKVYQTYWKKFSPVYREMSEFYYGEELPHAFIWRFLFLMLVAWYDFKIIDEID